MRVAAMIAGWVLAGVAFADDAPGAAAGGGDRYSGPGFATRAPVIAQHGMAATAQPLATMIAIDILKKGGSAVDAAIAANAALGLMEPVSCGIGGDLFAIVWDPKTQKLYGYNGSGRSPMGRSLADLKAKLGDRAATIPPLGSLPVTVPGAVDGWFALHDKFGKLPMDQVLAPAIEYARDGFPVTQLIADYWQGNFKGFEKQRRHDRGTRQREAHLSDRRQSAGAGRDLPQSRSRAHLRADRARAGATPTTKARSRRRSIAYFKRIGGDLRYEDFARAHGEWVDPVGVNYRGYDVYELPPNTQGVAALQMLKILEGFDLKKMGRGSADALHVMVEAKRLALRRPREVLRRSGVRTTRRSQELISDAYADAAARADRHGRMPIRTSAPGDVEAHAGRHDLSHHRRQGRHDGVADPVELSRHGLGPRAPTASASCSRIAASSSRSIPAHPNVYAPGKRPFQTIIPAS